MSFAIFKGETSVKDLVSRLFRLPDKTAKTAKQAADALLKANPQLREISKVPVGTVIDIPANAFPLNPSEEAPSSVARQVAIARQAQQSLYLLDQKLADIDARAADGANAFLALAQSKQAQALVQNSPDLKEQAPNLIASAQSLTKAVKAQQDARSTTVADFQNRLQMIPPTKS